LPVTTPPLEAIVIENSFLALPALLAAFTVKLNVPAVAGVPEITPDEERDKPPGKLPESPLQVTDVPLADNFWLYADPTVPPDNDPVVMAGAPLLPPSLSLFLPVSAPLPSAALPFPQEAATSVNVMMSENANVSMILIGDSAWEGLFLSFFVISFSFGMVNGSATVALKPR
jgi:hypothetical protein